jgi:hypothetical protein
LPDPIEVMYAAEVLMRPASSLLGQTELAAALADNPTQFDVFGSWLVMFTRSGAATLTVLDPELSEGQTGSRLPPAPSAAARGEETPRLGLETILG